MGALMVSLLSGRISFSNILQYKYIWRCEGVGKNRSRADSWQRSQSRIFRFGNQFWKPSRGSLALTVYLLGPDSKSRDPLDRCNTG